MSVTQPATYPVLYETLLSKAPMKIKNAALSQALLVVAGVVLLIICAKIKFPIPGSPVPVSMGTFGVLMIGAGYGPRLGLMTICSYMLVGLFGFDVFSNSSAESNGWAYMSGGTGGYLAGFVLACAAQGYLARKGWDRAVGWALLGMIIGNVIIYICGLAWLGNLFGWDKPILAWGLYPFIVGDLLKIAMAGALLPALWALVNRTKG